MHTKSLRENNVELLFAFTIMYPSNNTDCFVYWCTQTMFGFTPFFLGRNGISTSGSGLLLVHFLPYLFSGTLIPGSNSTTVYDITLVRSINELTCA